MPLRRIASVLAIALSLALSLGWSTDRTESAEPSASSPWGWPERTSASKPWSYWWWLGSTVDEAGLSSFLSRCQDAGMGGLHVIPIYGVRGLEEQYVTYLSPRWMELLHFTVETARGLGMDVDMSTGTGWPFGGGPQTTPEESCKKVILEEFPYQEERIEKVLSSDGRYQVVVTVSPEGRVVDLLSAPIPEEVSSSWHVYAVGQTPSRGVVERAAPGAEGLVVDPFSVQALRRYLKRFDDAFAKSPGPLPRAQYHDSYEYPGATWTDSLFEEFQDRRGYDLRDRLPELFGKSDPDTVARVKADLRATFAELHIEFLRHWVTWSHEHGCVTRNQAHGSPTNLLDAYAVADIPETESFGTPRLPRPDIDVGTQARTAPPHPLVMKFASSAAHTAGHRLTASESCTWLAEHFNVPLWLAKIAIDKLLVAGVNHVIYHGMAYSPPDAAWPGWRFYASTNFAPTNSFFRDFPALNAYIARCQSVLQAGSPDSDLLLYFPIHDIRHDAAGLLQHYTVHGTGWMGRGGLDAVASTLWTRGYGFDYVSDDLLSRAKLSDGRINLGDGSYRAILVPPCRLLPVETARKIADLAQEGAAVIFAGDVPADVPGLARLEERRRELRGVLRPLAESEHVFRGAELEVLLDRAGIRRESMVDLGLELVRRRHPSGHHYFVVNASSETIDGWVPLGTDCRSVVLLDPRFEDRAGLASLRRSSSGTSSVYLQLESGESAVLRTFEDQDIEGPSWTYLVPAADATQPSLQLGGSIRDEPPGEESSAVRKLDTRWQVTFLRGEPEVPAPFETTILDSWTKIGDERARRVAGTARYSARVTLPEHSGDWVLDLGWVADSARVRVNGQKVATLVSLPFSLPIGDHLQPGENLLEIDVTNLDANRIADLDRRGVVWRKFHEINFVNIRYRAFDASSWPPRPSGLLGPVRLIPMTSRQSTVDGQQ